MSLFVLVKIFNTGKTFFFVLYFITSKFATTFNFMKNTLDKLFFYNCLHPKIIYEDFAKRLVKSIATCEIKRYEIGLSE